jgi:uracil phosphoribosyltransferase
MKAVEVLKEAGVLEERIIFVNLVSNPHISVEVYANYVAQISAPEGLKTFCARFPQCRVVSPGPPLSHQDDF